MFNNKIHAKCIWELILHAAGWLLVILLTGAIIFSATSCNTSKVHRSVEKVKTDSLNVRKVFEQKAENVDSNTSKGNDITILKKEESDYDNETVIEYDTEKLTSVLLKSGQDNNVQNLHFVPIKKITIRSKGKSSSVDSSHQIDWEHLDYAKNENSSKIEEDSTQLIKETKTVNVDKKKSKVPIGGIIGVVMLLALIIFLKIKK